ncbi:hypothetical protein [Streptomyces sp. NBC_01431]|uniref:hypothetical protein n=1 Tax=Streptomyces sp. NBC_01431 TaxID=2903863 RepID=UPI002E345AE9|nr:hypothetical protein [Streptomyces sp. NBC_01431]
MAPGLRPLTAAATLTGALLLTPLPYASAVSTPSPSPPATATPSDSPNSSPSTRTSPPSARPSSPTASAEQRLAGSRAGEGRTRPGRVSPPHDFLPYAADDELQLPDAARPARQEDAPQTQTQPQTQPQTQTPVPKPPEPRKSAPPPAPSTAAKRPPSAHHHPSAQAVTDESDLRYHVLSLGAGLALTGLGLGFLGLRLRRS